MYNEFVLVGPPEDPAGIAHSSNSSLALKAIAQNQSQFISRNDNSGTHNKERELWAAIGQDPAALGSWYLKVGKGMEETLQIAEEKEAYTLSDEGTFYALEDKLSLSILYRGGEDLFNQYRVIVVNPARHPSVNSQAALQFAEWITSEEAQVRIGGYRVRTHQLFTPNQDRRP